MEKPEPKEENKFTIKETMDVFKYGNNLLDDLQKHKNDDGKIDSKEIATTLASNIPSGFKAYMGSSEVDDELGDLNDEEMMKIASEGAKLAKKLVALFMNKKEDQEEK